MKGTKSIATLFPILVSISGYSQTTTLTATIQGTKAVVSYDGSYFRECKTSIEPQNTDEDMEGEMPWAIAPRHYRFSFTTGSVQGSPRTYEVRLIPIHDWKSPTFKMKYHDLFETTKKLGPILATQPTSFPLGSTIPEWNLVDTEQTIHAKVKYLNGTTHHGILFISQETQETDGNPINSNETYCAYQGISNDGKWFITLQFAIANPTLPKDADAANHINRDPKRKYLLKGETLVNSLAPASFIPSIPSIEKLLASIQLP